ncbi:MAG: type II secretion system protein GspG [bacterium]
MTYAQKKDAFTLIEIMVVVFIIGLLAAMMGPRIMKVMTGGQTSAAQSGCIALKNAIIEYKMDTGQFPKTLEDLVKNTGGVSKWNGPYLEGKTSIDPDPWGNDYIYNKPPKVFDKYKSFEIISYGGDQGEGEPQDKWLSAGS